MPFLLTDANHRDEASFPKDTAHRSIKDSKETKGKHDYDLVLAALSHPEI